MFDSSNIIFIILIAAIFTIRAVVEARKKKKAPPPPPQRPKVPLLHFEEVEKEKTPAASPAARAAAKIRKKQAPALADLIANTALFPKGDAGSPSVTGNKSSAVQGNTQAASPEKKGFPLNLNHLSPLKQAVVMAEILGQPKGIL